MTTTEKVRFRLIQMPCCQTLICWINSRHPAYCPECGGPVLLKIKTGECTLVDDDNAWLKYSK